MIPLLMVAQNEEWETVTVSDNGTVFLVAKNIHKTSNDTFLVKVMLDMQHLKGFKTDYIQSKEGTIYMVYEQEISSNLELIRTLSSSELDKNKQIIKTKEYETSSLTSNGPGSWSTFDLQSDTYGKCNRRLKNWIDNNQYVSIYEEKSLCEKISPQKDNSTNKSAQQKIASEPLGYIHNHQYIDLGLPSGTLWATQNIGAISPSDSGNYYAYGETTTKEVYKNIKAEKLGQISGNSFFDAAARNWDYPWRMPTLEHYQELIDYCKWNVTLMNGRHGYKIVGPNGNSIFLPAVGYKEYNSVMNDNCGGYYWIAEADKPGIAAAHYLFFGKGGIVIFDHPRGRGCTIRPIINNH